MRRSLLLALVLLALGAAGCAGDDPAANAPLTPVGLTVAAAGDLVEDQGRPWRVIEEDGEDLVVTADFLPERLNFVVSEGVVISAKTDAELAGG